jgi:hypothetical protein
MKNVSILTCDAITADEAIDKIVVIFIQISHNLLRGHSFLFFFGGGKPTASEERRNEFLRTVHN